MDILIRSAFSAVVVLCLAGYAHAGTINFNALADGAYGEGAFNPLVLSVGGATVTITGHASVGADDDSTQYAYLDSGNAGLGVCRDVLNTSLVGTTQAGRTSNNCNPSSDDNTTNNEYLKFVFDRDVTINNLWFNNNHDGGFNAGDKVRIQGTLYAVATGYVGGANGIGSFFVTANTPFIVKYYNEQFYISGMEVTVPNVPDAGATLVLLTLAMFSLVAVKLSGRG